jgi:alpha-1,3-fucosyltransferase
MNNEVIPIVFSGVELSRFLPPKSYIDANSFETVEDLGSHLKYLAETPAELVKYFWWKQHYKIQLDSFDVCEICRKLNEPKLLSKRSIYSNINDWFNNQACTAPKIRFEA